MDEKDFGSIPQQGKCAGGCNCICAVSESGIVIQTPKAQEEKE
jgi:hypothetical protein